MKQDYILSFLHRPRRLQASGAFRADMMTLTSFALYFLTKIMQGLLRTLSITHAVLRAISMLPYKEKKRTIRSCTRHSNVFVNNMRGKKIKMKNSLSTVKLGEMFQLNIKKCKGFRSTLIKVKASDEYEMKDLLKCSYCRDCACIS